VADGVDELPDAQSVRIPDRGCRQVVGSLFEAEQREVQVLPALRDLGAELAAVAQDHGHLRTAATPGHDVVVGEHEALCVPDHARPGAAAPGAHLHDALVSAPDHLRARRRGPDRLRSHPGS
jgi:hypothetical protein